MNNENQTPTPQYVRQEKSVGPVIGIIIIVMLMVLGAMYFWGERLEKASQLRQADESAAQQTSPNTPANPSTTTGLDVSTGVELNEPPTSTPTTTNE